MVTNKFSFKKLLVAQFTIDDVLTAPYTDVVYLPIDNSTINSGTSTGRSFYGGHIVKTNEGVVKAGFEEDYHSSGANDGYLQITEGGTPSSVFATGDTITVIGTLI